MDAVERIKAIVAGHPAVLFMKGTPQFPMCGHSHRAVTALHAAGLPFHAVNVLEDPEIRAGLPAFINQRSFPQLFVQGELIGGCDIIEELHASGELARLLSPSDADDGADA